MKKIENILFISALSIIMLGGFIKPIIAEETDNYYENRPAYLLPKISLESMLNKTYQDEFEKALSDQLPLSSRMKQIQKNIGLLTQIIYTKTSHDNFVNLQGLLLKDEYLLYQPVILESVYQQLESKTNNINDAVLNNKKTEFYLYYIEKDTDIDFVTNKKSGIYEYLESNISDKVTKGVFEINSFDDYKKYFYTTDHHWNYVGSYNAYLDLCKIFNFKPLDFKEEVHLGQTWSGSKAREIGGDLLFKETFSAYKFSFKEHKTYINNLEVPEYGNTNECFNKKNNFISYGHFYGGDNGLVEFDYNDSKKDNLLIIGESYDNAINELLASHFNKTYNVDLRAYKSEIGKEFELKKFIKEKDIDKVLLIGNKDYFVLDTFMLYN